MGKRRTRYIQEEAMDINNKTFIDYYNRLMELALNVFRWENLPPTIDPRFLELTLYEKGYAVYFNDDEIGNLALTCTIGGDLNVYRIPIYRRAFATNGYQKNLTADDSVLIFNNYLHTPTVLTTTLYAKRIYNITRAIDVNINAQKTPVTILCDETQRLTMKNLYMKYDGNEPFIFGDKNLDLNGISVLNTQAPFVADKLNSLKHQILNEYLTFCGIENSNTDKKERLVANEVSSNYGEVEAERNIMLNSRQEAADQINRMFGTNIKVSFRSDLPTLVNGITSIKEEE